MEKDQTNGKVGDDIPVLKVRHLSLIGQLLPKSWFDVVMEYSPRQQAILRWNDEQVESSTSKAEQISRDILRIRMGEFSFSGLRRGRYDDDGRRRFKNGDLTLVSH